MTNDSLKQSKDILYRIAFNCLSLGKKDGEDLSKQYYSTEKNRSWVHSVFCILKVVSFYFLSCLLSPDMPISLVKAKSSFSV